MSVPFREGVDADVTLRWLDQYQKGRFKVCADTSAMSKEVNKLGGLGRQIVVAIMLVGVIVDSAIAAAAIRCCPS